MGDYRDTISFCRGLGHTIASSLSPTLTSPGTKDRTKSLYRTVLLLEENFPTTFLASSLASGIPLGTEERMLVRTATIVPHHMNVYERCPISIVTV